MAKRFFGYVWLTVLLVLCSACTAQQRYASAQSYQRNQCLQMPDQGDREKCLSYSAMSYDDYKRQATAPER